MLLMEPSPFCGAWGCVSVCLCVHRDVADTNSLLCSHTAGPEGPRWRRGWAHLSCPHRCPLTVDRVALPVAWDGSSCVRLQASPSEPCVSASSPATRTGNCPDSRHRFCHRSGAGVWDHDAGRAVPPPSEGSFPPLPASGSPDLLGGGSVSPASASIPVSASSPGVSLLCLLGLSCRIGATPVTIRKDPLSKAMFAGSGPGLGHSLWG